jgi:hypothetical protein
MRAVSTRDAASLPGRISMMVLRSGGDAFSPPGFLLATG